MRSAPPRAIHIMKTESPGPTIESQALTPLQRANWSTWAANEMSQRADRYRQKAETDTTLGWFYWAMRSLRAARAAIRLLRIAERQLRQAMGDAAACPLAGPRRLPPAGRGREAA